MTHKRSKKIHFPLYTNENVKSDLFSVGEVANIQESK